MVIGDVDLDALDNAIDSIEAEVGRAVNYTLFSVGEWQERVSQGHSFVTDVLTHEKVFLIGDEDDLSTGYERNATGPSTAWPELSPSAKQRGLSSLPRNLLPCLLTSSEKELTLNGVGNREKSDLT